ncbi:histone-like nucleoid-structuring protein Lsr2 [Brachybacterium paraconglomeratum]|uniref:histone-like nucleoid-structuring protein Lsr2 n=1 Tax=Brachybacterium paraconglomeratum TaxID=173362 RepID=UPI0022AE9ACA|nr:Lsr2 family protein [Brachybacterium paraconglomeratum]MCZ4328123.1 Lsr2 family protein [Brachybacterium paraconglomeratum]
MARKIETLLIDDIDGTEATETFVFSYDGKAWEIDLNAENAATIRADLGKWQQHARRAAATARTASGSPKRRSASRSPEQLNAIRTWARENGYEVSDRGRLAKNVEDAYNEAHGSN